MTASANLPTTLHCPQCQEDNPLEARTCISCKASLAVARAQRYLDLAEADITAARYDHARSNLTQADVEMLGLSSKTRKENLFTARAFWLQGLIYYHKGQTGESRTELLLALQNLEAMKGSEALTAKVLNQLGNAAFYERTTDAAEYYQRSSEVAISADEHALAATALANLALIHNMGGNIEEAFAWYEQALAEAELGGDPIRLGDTYRLVASLYADEGPYPRALVYINKALALCNQIPNPAAVCRITLGAGELYLRYRDLEQAERWLRQADELASRIDYKLLYNSTAVALSNLLRIKGDYPAALNYASRAYNQIHLALTERGEAMLALALYYIDLADWMHAERYIQRLGDISAGQALGSDQFYHAHARTLLYTAQGEWQQAEQDFQQASTITQTLHNKYELANLQEEYATRMLAYIGARHNPTIQVRAHALLVEAAATFRQMEMPLRHGRIATMLRRTPNQVAS